MILDLECIPSFTISHFFTWQYNTKDSSVRLAYEAQPRPKAVASLSRETIVKVACGTNHTGYFHIILSCLKPGLVLCYVINITR